MHFDQHVKQLNAYVAYNSSLDINALYIAQAHLTKIQVLLNPTSLLTTLFSSQHLSIMYQLCNLQYLYISQLQYNEDIVILQLLQYFTKPNTKEPPSPSINLCHSSTLLNKILSSLQQWSHFKQNANNLHFKIKDYCTSDLQISSEQNIIDHNKGNKNKQIHQFITAESENQYCSIEQKIFGQTVKTSVITKQEIVQFMELLSQWMYRTFDQINQYKTTLLGTRSHSSLHQYKFSPTLKKNPNESIPRKSLLTSKIQRASLSQNTDHIDKDSSYQSRSRERTMPLSRMDINVVRQFQVGVSSKRSKGNCSKCEIF